VVYTRLWWEKYVDQWNVGGASTKSRRRRPIPKIGDGGAGKLSGRRGAARRDRRRALSRAALDPAEYLENSKN